MPREWTLETAITDAIEASYYVSPERPGLHTSELNEILQPFGFRPGEIREALLHRVEMPTFATPNGFVFGEDLPLSLSDGGVAFPEDPRDWSVYEFVHARLQQLAREHGLAKARLGLAELAIEGHRRELDPHQVTMAIHGLDLMNLAKIDAEKNTISLTERGLRWASLENRRVGGQYPSYSRPNFPGVLDAVRAVIAKRSDHARWSELRAALAAVVDGASELAPDETQILDHIGARFAESGAPVSIDEAVRLMQDLEVRSTIHGPLEQRALVVPKGVTVVPSLLALRRHIDRYRDFFLLADEVLRRAKASWERSATTVPLRGTYGLEPSTGTRLTTNPTLASRQLAILIDSNLMRPVLFPANNGMVDIRDDIRKTDTIAKLVAYQQEKHTRQKPQVVLSSPFPPARDEQRTKMNADPKTETLSILFLDLAAWSKLGPVQIINYVAKVLPQLDQVVREHSPRHLNSWGDAIVATFRSAVDAAKCALHVRDLFTRGSELDGVPKGVRPRIALHLGEVIIVHNPLIEREDTFGDAVHASARLEPVTPAGRVFCTEEFAKALDAVDGAAPTAHDAGEVTLAKGAGVIRAYVVTWANEDPPATLPPK